MGRMLALESMAICDWASEHIRRNPVAVAGKDLTFSHTENAVIERGGGKASEVSFLCIQRYAPIPLTRLACFD